MPRPRCQQCKADLRLDQRNGLFQSTEGSTIVVPGKPDQSELLARITSDDPELHMPPPKSGRPLSPHQTGLIKEWITQGAEWKGHWAYLPLTRPAVPAVRDRPRLTNEIDRFIQARLAVEQLEPAPESTGAPLLRLSFDLIGLPPTPSEVDVFLNDSTPEAYEHLVDRLLASPRDGGLDFDHAEPDRVGPKDTIERADAELQAML